MFSLEKSIAEWRKQMLAAGIKTPVPLEELEIHLREEIERQTGLGLSEAEAFEAGVQKIGPAQTVQKEFKKVEATQAAGRWSFFEVYLLASTLLIPLVTGFQAFVFKGRSFSELTAGQQMAILTAAVAFSLFAWVMRWSHGKFPVLRTHRIRDAIFVPVLLWVVACIIVLPRCGFADAQRALVSMWAFSPFGVLIGWSWGFVTAARKKAMAADKSASQG